MRTRRLTVASLGCFLLWTATVGAAPARKEHAYKIGKRGEFTLTQPTKVSNMVLQPDTYVVQHRVDKAGNHLVRFVKLTEGETFGVMYIEEDRVGEVKCRVEPALGTTKVTTVYTATDGGVVRITKVLIKGENVVHVLP